MEEGIDVVIELGDALDTSELASVVTGFSNNVAEGVQRAVTALRSRMRPMLQDVGHPLARRLLRSNLTLDVRSVGDVRYGDAATRRNAPTGSFIFLAHNVVGVQVAITSADGRPLAHLLGEDNVLFLIPPDASYQILFVDEDPDAASASALILEGAVQLSAEA